MKYLLKISAIGGDEERHQQVEGSITDVYLYMKEHCRTGEIADIYEEEVYTETAIRLPGSVAQLTHRIEW
ncbi:hypothetical protein [Leyella stercorea]|jgi:hypothetical protein|uniref:hypothetical protein n=1 Tax=Leyella stercorea TaxID=363265 RepID=UPI00242ED3CC|nr:hypothetical protein [Leyella stercorea]